MEALLITLIERQSVEFKELKDSLKELKAENEILRKEILGIGVSAASSGQQGMGLMEKRTLREIVEENQFHLKALNTKLERSLHELVVHTNKQEPPTESAAAGSYSGYSHSVNINNSSKPGSKSKKPESYPRKLDFVAAPGKKGSSPPRLWPLLPKLPDCELAIHFGLHHTLAGIVTPGTDDVLILHDIDNCLYFDHPDLLLCSEDPKCRKCSPSRIPNILETPPNFPVGVSIEKIKRFMRLEELIACLFAALKWKTELDQMVEISNSVICIPQCLNLTQRKTVRDAAQIAGFSRVTLIDDTSAVALAVMLKNSVVTSRVIVANTSEGVIDAGHFTFDNGVILRGSTAEYFTKTKGDRGVVNKHMYFLGHLGTENSEFRKNVLQLFKGYVDGSGSPIPRKRTHLNSIVLSGNPNELVNQVRRVLDFDPRLNCREVQHIIEDDKAALFGAAYLTVLNDFKPEHPIFARWAALTTLKPSQELLYLFRKSLLHQKHVQGVLTLITPPRHGNLDEADFNVLKDDFYLNERRQRQEMKMHILKKLLYLESSARHISHVGEYEKQDIIAQIDTIRRDMQTSEFPVEQICVYDQNLDDLLDKVSP